MGERKMKERGSGVGVCGWGKINEWMKLAFSHLIF